MVLQFFLLKELIRIHFWYMSKDEAVTILRNADLTEKKP